MVTVQKRVDTSQLVLMALLLIQIIIVTKGLASVIKMRTGIYCTKFLLMATLLSMVLVDDAYRYTPACSINKLSIDEPIFDWAEDNDIEDEWNPPLCLISEASDIVDILTLEKSQSKHDQTWYKMTIHNHIWPYTTKHDQQLSSNLTLNQKLEQKIVPHTIFSHSPKY